MRFEWNTVLWAFHRIQPSSFSCLPFSFLVFFVFGSFPYFFCLFLVPCGRLSWVSVSFLTHIKYLVACGIVYSSRHFVQLQWRAHDDIPSLYLRCGRGVCEYNTDLCCFSLRTHFPLDSLRRLRLRPDLLRSAEVKCEGQGHRLKFMITGEK